MKLCGYWIQWRSKITHPYAFINLCPHVIQEIARFDRRGYFSQQSIHIRNSFTQRNLLKRIRFFNQWREVMIRHGCVESLNEVNDQRLRDALPTFWILNFQCFEFFFVCPRFFCAVRFNSSIYTQTPWEKRWWNKKGSRQPKYHHLEQEQSKKMSMSPIPNIPNTSWFQIYFWKKNDCDEEVFPRL